MDKIYTATVWTVYCFVGPYFKERRQLSAFGARFLEYCARVPFWPGLQQKIVEVKHCEDQR